MTVPSMRMVTPTWWCPKLGEPTYPFKSAVPYTRSLLSVDTLNMELEDTGSKLRVEETRFRPNFLIKGDFPGFQEDKWVMVSRSTDCVVHIFLALQVASCQDWGHCVQECEAVHQVCVHHHRPGHRDQGWQGRAAQDAEELPGQSGPGGEEGVRDLALLWGQPGGGDWAGGLGQGGGQDSHQENLILTHLYCLFVLKYWCLFIGCILWWFRNSFKSQWSLMIIL